jgi:endonuclease III
MTTACIYEIMKKMKQTLSYEKLARPTALKGLQAEEKQDPFKILIGTILSARTRDEITTKVVNSLFRKFKNPEELAEADIDVVKAIIHSIGFYNVKAKRIKEVSQLIVERFNGEVPNDIRKLLELPGVGRKTANCVLVYGFNKAAIPVDILGLVNTKSPEKTEIELSRILDKKYWLKVNDTFVMYGQNICLPIKPNCNLCKLKEVCKFYHTTVLPIRKNSSLKISAP